MIVVPKKSNKERSDGRIAVQIYLGIVDGKRKYKTVYGKTQKEADKKAQVVKNDLGIGVDMLCDDTFGYWRDQWLKSQEQNTTISQYRFYKGKAKAFDCLEKLDVKTIKLQQIQSIIDKIANCNPCTKRPTSKKTLYDYVYVVNQVFVLAIANRSASFNPAEELKVPINAPKNKRRALTKEEQQRIIDTEHRAKTAAMLALFSGLRRGEIPVLMWTDLNFATHEIDVNKAITYKGAKNYEIKRPKTSAGRRKVVMVDVLENYLKSLPHTSIYIFPSSTGSVMLEGAWERLWKSYMNTLNKKYGDFSKIKSLKNNKGKNPPMVIEPFTMHCLRHTYCTMLYDSGVDVMTAQYLMGHADVKTTLGIYTHLSEENKNINVSKLNDFVNASQMQVNESQK